MVRRFRVNIEQIWSLEILIDILPVCSTAFERWAGLSCFSHTSVFPFIISLNLGLMLVQGVLITFSNLPL